MVYVFFVLAGVFGVLYLLRHFSGLDAAGRKRFWKRFAFALVFGLVLILTMTGRLHAIAAVVTALIPFLKKAWPLARAFPFLKGVFGSGGASPASAGQHSEVSTSLLRMELDHDSARLDGEVLAGALAGKRLSELSQGQLAELYQEAVSAHADSVQVLEAFLQRELGEQWQEVVGRHASSGGHGSTDSLQEAYEVLGLSEGASREQVIQAHRQLMQKFHPDRGGNDYLAARINEAKDRVLEALGES